MKNFNECRIGDGLSCINICRLESTRKIITEITFSDLGYTHFGLVNNSHFGPYYIATAKPFIIDDNTVICPTENEHDIITLLKVCKEYSIKDFQQKIRNILDID